MWLGQGWAALWLQILVIVMTSSKIRPQSVEYSGHMPDSRFAQNGVQPNPHVIGETLNIHPINDDCPKYGDPRARRRYENSNTVEDICQNSPFTSTREPALNIKRGRGWFRVPIGINMATMCDTLRHEVEESESSISKRRGHG